MDDKSMLLAIATDVWSMFTSLHIASLWPRRLPPSMRDRRSIVSGGKYVSYRDPSKMNNLSATAAETNVETCGSISILVS